jgi:PKD repeat protein
VQVTSSGASPTRATGTPLQGVAPLTVTFSITSDQPIQSVNGEFAAGSPFSVSPFSGTLSFTYQQPGAHTAIFNVVRADGTTVTKTLRIVVQSVAEVDQLLRTAWNGFTQALVARDKVAAMKSLTVSAQARYGRVFDALLASLPTVAASVSAPERGVLTGSVGEYFVTRQIPDGTLRLFLIYFIRDADGVWRLDTM